MAADLLLATWGAAFIEAHRAARQGRDPGQAQALFLAIVDRGTAGVTAAMAGTPYA
ncbi:hypothetical protein [Ancylobacter mangrovi]|uniref:hypothetical protein n=1 Tax=Ancylobacter mangrovi TaxID=2972472 RepID=UPI0028680CCA|nr:hypothetical protein [Ancylobacter mangrovi]